MSRKAKYPKAAETFEVQSAVGSGHAVPLRNLGISNGMRSCLKAKQCERQLGFASDNPLTLLNNTYPSR